MQKRTLIKKIKAIIAKVERIRLRNRITDKRRAMKNPISKAIRPKGFSCLTYTEQRLLAYLNARKCSNKPIGRGFVKKNGYYTKRAQGVNSLAKLGVIAIVRRKNNQLYFQLKTNME